MVKEQKDELSCNQYGCSNSDFNEERMPDLMRMMFPISEKVALIDEELCGNINIIEIYLNNDSPEIIKRRRHGCDDTTM